MERSGARFNAKQINIKWQVSMAMLAKRLADLVVIIDGDVTSMRPRDWSRLSMAMSLPVVSSIDGDACKNQMMADGCDYRWR